MSLSPRSRRLPREHLYLVLVYLVFLSLSLGLLPPGLGDFPANQLWAIAPACSVTGEGLEEAMDCLQQLVLKAAKLSNAKPGPHK